MTIRFRTVIAGMGLAAFAMMPLNKWGHVPTSTAEAAQAKTSVPPLQAFGMRFSQIRVADNHRPILPNGRAGVTKSQAIGVALGYTTGARHHKLLPNVKVVARYGIFSDDQLSKRNAAGVVQPLYQNRPAWLVTFSGGAVVEAPSGRCCGPLPGNHTEDNVVVDAATGKWLESFT